MYLDGYHYTRATTSKRKTAYRCRYYRPAGCTGKVDLFTHTKQFTNFIPHTCERRDQADIEISDPTTTSTGATNTPHLTQDQAQDQSQCRGEVLPRPVTLTIRIAPNHIDPMLLGQIESPPLSLVRHSTLNFFQFNCMSGYGPNNTPNRVIGWAHPHLIELLRHAGSTIYVDNSLRRLPSGFKRCIALVVHDKPSSLFVPVFYVLCTMRTQSAYRNALSFIIQSTRRKLKPDEIICNFDSDLVSVLQARFPNAVVKGSLHLLKQACRVRMEQLEISDEAVNIAMEKGVLDMLASIPSDRVVNAGISWVKQQIKTKCAGIGVPYVQDQWRSFWLYFRNTFVDQFVPAVWNLHGLRHSIIARTNNPVEQFHKELDAAFILPDPDLQYFIAIIEKMARRYLADLATKTTTLPRPIEMCSENDGSSDVVTIEIESGGDINAIVVDDTIDI